MCHWKFSFYSRLRLLRASTACAIVWLALPLFLLLFLLPVPTQAEPITINREELTALIREIVRSEIAHSTSPSSSTSEAEISRNVEQRVEKSTGKNAGKSVVKTLEPKDQQDEPIELSNKTTESDSPWKFSVDGYGDIRFAHYDYTETGFPPEGSRGASRSVFDLSRFTVAFEGEHEPTQLEFEAEIEFEHGGTGAALELEQDEFGEFETEAEKGGEVLLEELYVKKEFGDGWSGRIGRFYVGVGLLSQYFRPIDYLSSTRSETETTLLPGVWDEIGIEVKKELSIGDIQFQLVNGLDSTGFSASQWVASGKQDRFEVNRAQDLAAVLRFDITAIDPLVIGMSSYYSHSTTNNRPKNDLEDADGAVFIGDVHARYWGSELRTQGAILWGHLSDADLISDRNSRLSNELGVERTAVADEALGIWGELGYNVGSLLGWEQTHRLDPFLRVDYYDTYFETRTDLADNTRYERTVYTAGLTYTYDQIFVTKLDYSIRDFGQSELSTQNSLRLGVGFVY